MINIINTALVKSEEKHKISKSITFEWLKYITNFNHIIMLGYSQGYTQQDIWIKK